MKNYIFSAIGILIIPLFSCQEKTDTSLVEIKTTVNIEIPITAESFDDSKSVLNTSEIDYSFAGANSYSVSSLAESENGILKIKKVQPESGTVLSFSGVKEGNEISSLQLEWGYKSSISDDYIMKEPINLLSLENTLKDEILEVKLDEVIVHLMNSIDNQNSSIKIKITGKSNFDFNCVAKLVIPVTVESETFTTRFALF
jgi:hypothetical protein